MAQGGSATRDIDALTSSSKVHSGAVINDSDILVRCLWCFAICSGCWEALLQIWFVTDDGKMFSLICYCGLEDEARSAVGAIFVWFAAMVSIFITMETGGGSVGIPMLFRGDGSWYGLRSFFFVSRFVFSIRLVVVFMQCGCLMVFSIPMVAWIVTIMHCSMLLNSHYNATVMLSSWEPWL